LDCFIIGVSKLKEQNKQLHTKVSQNKALTKCGSEDQ